MDTHIPPSMLTVHHHPSPCIAAGLTSLMMVADGKYFEAVECQGKEFAKKKLESLGHAQVLIIVEGVAENVTSTYNTIGCLTAASISAREKQYKKDVSALAEVHKELSIVPDGCERAHVRPVFWQISSSGGSASSSQSSPSAWVSSHSEGEAHFPG